MYISSVRNQRAQQLIPHSYGITWISLCDKIICHSLYHRFKHLQIVETKSESMRAGKRRKQTVSGLERAKFGCKGCTSGGTRSWLACAKYVKIFVTSAKEWIRNNKQLCSRKIFIPAHYHGTTKREDACSRNSLTEMLIHMKLSIASVSKALEQNSFTLVSMEKCMFVQLRKHRHTPYLEEEYVHTYMYVYIGCTIITEHKMTQNECKIKGAGLTSKTDRIRMSSTRTVHIILPTQNRFSEWTKIVLCMPKSLSE